MTRRNGVAVLVLLSFVLVAFLPLVRTVGAQPARIKIAIMGVENKTEAPLAADEAIAALNKAFSASDRYSVVNPDDVARVMAQAGLSSDSSTSIRAMILGKTLEADQIVIVSLNRCVVKGAKVDVSAQASFYDCSDGRFLRSASLSGEGSGIQDAFNSLAAQAPAAATTAAQGGTSMKSGTLLAILGVAGIVAAVSGNKGTTSTAPASSSGGSTSSSSSSSGGPTPTPIGTYTMGPITKESSIISGSQTTIRFSVAITQVPPVDSEGKGAPVVWAVSGSTAVVAFKGTATSYTDFTGKAYIEVTSALSNNFQVTASNRTLTGTPSMNTSVLIDSTGNVTTGQSVTPTSARVVLEANPSSGLYASSQKATTISVTAYKTATELADDGTPVTITQSPSNFGTFEGGSTATTINGVAKFNYSSQNTGNVAMFASALNKQSNLLNMSFGTPSLSSIVLVDNQVNIPSTGRSTQYFKVTANPPVAGYEVQWTSSTGNIVPKGTVSNITNAAGEAVVAVDVPFSTSYQITAVLKIGSQTYSPQSMGVTVAADGSTSGSSGSARVVLSAQSTILIADNTNMANMTAVVMDSTGKLLSGIPVQFTSSPAGGTFVDANPAMTNASGQATMRYRTGTVGTVAVTATASISGQSVPSSPVNLDFGIPAVTLVSDKDSIIANNTETATLTAMVYDPTGAPASGKFVTFSADPSGTGEFVGTNPATTDSTGAAVIKYRSVNRSFGNVTVTAQANFGTSPLVFKGTKALTLVKDTHSVALVSSSDTLIADDTTMITLTSTVLDAAQNPASGVQVTFSGAPATSGTFVGTNPATTNAQGVAAIQYKSRNRATGNVTLKASASIFPLTFEGTAQVTQTLDAHMIGLVAAPASIVADDTTTTTISATVANAAGTPDQDVPVTFTASPNTTGVFVGNNPANTNTQGVATIQYRSQNRATGNVTITGQANIGSLAFSGNTQVTLTQDTHTIAISASPASIVADNTAETTITATVRNAAGNPVPDKLVTFAQNPVNFGTFTTATQVLTNQSGQATVKFKSLNMVSGTVNINAQISVPPYVFTSPDQPVTLTPNTHTMTLASAPTAIVADNITLSTITATVLNSLGNPAAGIAVTFSANPAGSGTLVGLNPATTGADGKATIQYKGNVGATPGTITIKGDATLAGSTPPIAFSGTTGVILATPPSQFMLSANPTHILSNGIAETVLTALAYNADGTQGTGNVVFTNTTANGTFINVSGSPTGSPATVPLVNGTASIRLRSPFTPSNTVINATWAATPAIIPTVTVYFDGSFASDAASIILTVPTSPAAAQLQVANTGGTSSVLVTADVKKADGTAVADGTVVNFAISGPAASGGAYIEGSKTTTAGKAVSTLYAGTVPGEIIVTATCGSVSTDQALAKVSSGPPQAVSAAIGAGSLHNIDGYLIYNVNTTVDIMVRDKYGNPVPDGTPVSLTTDFGTVDTGPFTTVNGMVSAILFRSSLPKPTLAKNFVTITVSAGMSGGSPGTLVDTSVYCLVTGPATTGTTTFAPPITIIAGKALTASLTVKDILNNPLMKGSIIRAILTGENPGTITEQTVPNDTMGIGPGWTGGTTVLTFTYNAPTNLGPGGTGASQKTTTLNWECETPHGSKTSTADGSLVIPGFPCTVTINPDNPAALNLLASKAIVKANNVAPCPAGSVDYVQLDATLTDQYQNPINNAPITFSSSLSGVGFTTVVPSGAAPIPGTSPSLTVNTDINGKATCYAVGSNVGQANITAVSGTLSGTSAVTFTADVPSRVELTNQPTTVTGDNAAAINVSAHVYDAYNHNCSGVIVQFATDHPEMTTFGNANVTTGADGIAATTLTGRYEGPNASQAVAVTATASGIASVPGNVTFKRTPVSMVQILPDVTKVVADWTSRATLSIKALNAQSRPVQGAVITLSTDLQNSELANTGATPSAGTSIVLPATGADGTVATATTTRSRAPGLANIVAAVPLDGYTSTPTVITFTGVPVSANSSFAITPASVVGDNATPATCRVILRNNDGYVCPDVKVNFRITAGTGGTLSASQSTTGADGSCSVTITGLAEDADHTVTVEASTPDFTACVLAPQNVVFTKLTPASVQIGSNIQTIVANSGGSGGTALLTIRVLNVLGRPVSGQSVTISSSLVNTLLQGSGAAAQTITETTNASGYTATVALTGSRAGSTTITAAAGAASNTTAVTLVAGNPDAALSSLQVVANNIKGDLTESANVTATLKDSNGNPVPGNNVTFSLSGAQAATTGFGAGMAGTIVVATGQDGTATTTVKGSRSGTATISALPNAPYTGAFPLSQALTMRYVPSAVALGSLQGSYQTYISGVQTGKYSRLTAEVRSATGELAPNLTPVYFNAGGYTGATFADSPANVGTQSIASANTDVTGVATIYSWANGTVNNVAGTVAVTARAGESATWSSAVNIAITPTPPDTITRTQPPASPVVVARQTAITVQFRLTAGGVNVPNWTIDFATNGGSLSTPSATTDTSGLATITITFPEVGFLPAGTYTLTASARNAGGLTATAQFTLP
jgi:adhesin/invasin